MKKLLISSKLFVSLMSTINFSSLRLDHFIQFLNTSCHKKRVFESLLDNLRESALSVVPEESWCAHFLSRDTDFLWHLGLVNQTDQQQVALFWHDRQTTTGWTANLRQESHMLVYGSLHLLAPVWTVVKRAPCRWCSHRTPDHAGTVLAGGFLDVRFSSLRDVAVVGLITCERVVLGKGAKVLITRGAQGICPPHRGRRSWRPGGETRRQERR